MNHRGATAPLAMPPTPKASSFSSKFKAQQSGGWGCSVFGIVKAVLAISLVGTVILTVLMLRGGSPGRRPAADLVAARLPEGDADHEALRHSGHASGIAAQRLDQEEGRETASGRVGGRQALVEAPFLVPTSQQRPAGPDVDADAAAEPESSQEDASDTAVPLAGAGGSEDPTRVGSGGDEAEDEDDAASADVDGSGVHQGPALPAPVQVADAIADYHADIAPQASSSGVVEQEAAAEAPPVAVEAAPISAPAPTSALVQESQSQVEAEQREGTDEEQELEEQGEVESPQTADEVPASPSTQAHEDSDSGVAAAGVVQRQAIEDEDEDEDAHDAGVAPPPAAHHEAIAGDGHGAGVPVTAAEHAASLLHVEDDAAAHNDARHHTAEHGEATTSEHAAPDNDGGGNPSSAEWAALAAQQQQQPAPTPQPAPLPPPPYAPVAWYAAGSPLLQALQQRAGERGGDYAIASAAFHMPLPATWALRPAHGGNSDANAAGHTASHSDDADDTPTRREHYAMTGDAASPDAEQPPPPTTLSVAASWSAASDTAGAGSPDGAGDLPLYDRATGEVLTRDDLVRIHKILAAQQQRMQQQQQQAAAEGNGPAITSGEYAPPLRTSALPVTPFPRLPGDEAGMAAAVTAFQHSWAVYKAHAWGSDTVKPISKQADNGFLGMAISITDSLSTLAIMGLQEELEEGIAFVCSDKLTFNHQEDINVFESTIRVVGGLASAWELTGRRHSCLLDKARSLADASAMAFDSPTGIPYGTVGLASGRKYNPQWMGGASTISEATSLQLEYEYLSHATGDVAYARRGRRVMSHLMALEPTGDSLYPMYLHPEAGGFTSSVITMGARADSLYEYLLKQYLLAGGIRQATIERLQAAVDEAAAETGGQRNDVTAAAVASLGLHGNAAVLAAAAAPASEARSGGNVYGPPEGSPARSAWVAGGAVAASELQRLRADATAGDAGASLVPGHGSGHFLYACTDGALAPCLSSGNGSAATSSACIDTLAAALQPLCGVDGAPAAAVDAVVSRAPLAAAACRAFPWHMLHGHQPQQGGETPAAAAAAAFAGVASCAASAPAPTAVMRALDAQLSEAAWFTSILGMYWRSSAGIDHHLMRYSNPSRFAFVTERHGPGHYDDKMDHLVCFWPGVLALGGLVAPTPALRVRHLTLAKQLLATCIHMYDQTASGVAAEITRFPNGGQDPVPDPGAKHNLLRPETVESLMVLYRVTGDEQYREAGRRILSAFNARSRVESGGYSTLRDVTAAHPEKSDAQESFWLAETLKYLYLLSAPSDVIPLDEYVFNTEAHPLPVL